ncbi:uncharacterized protein LOC143876124 isoform X2 [Tasmannia lanceolata]|uniref:uncharacterized protein LOC143876124 isoform X2 n=1 Tax=Tasmannia lanceolata TaxID=3420 RepID=UPI004063D764
MASFHRSKPIRRLHELLEEQQEPFLLDVYLLEKGNSRKGWNSESRTRFWPCDSCQNVQSLCNYSFRKRRVRIINCSKILRSVLTKIVSGKNRKAPNCDYKASVNGRFSVSDLGGETQVVELDRFSTASSATVFDSCSDGDMDESHSAQKSHISLSSTDAFRVPKLHTMKEKAATYRKVQWGYMEDCKQLSPVSVLEVPSDEVQFCPRACKEEHPSEETILSAPQWEFLLHSLEEKQSIEVAKPEELLKCCSSFLKAKRVSQQTNQLLIDCVKEVVESRSRKGRWNFDEFLGPELLGKTIFDQICSWGKQGGDVTNITHLIKSDFSNSIQEWRHFHPQVKQIGIEIGDAIFEDIRDEIVSDFFALERCC